MDFRHILVALDGSADADAALTAAVAFGKPVESIFHLLFVVDLGEVAGGALAKLPDLTRLDALLDFPDKVSEALESRGAEVQAAARERVTEAGLTANLIKEFGGPLEWVLCHGRDADLIALGRRGAGGVQPPDLGRITTHLLGNLPAPLLVGGGATPVEIRRPLLAYDGRSASHAALNPVLGWAAAAGVALTVLHLPGHGSREKAAHVQDHAREHGVELVWKEADPARAGEDPAGLITQEVRQGGFDLLVLGAWGYREDDRPGPGSPVFSAVQQAEAPTLVFPG